MRDYSFGNFLYELRMRRGLTQYQLGTLVGVSSQAVSKWENGSSKPQSNILYKLSEVLGISVDELLTCKYHSFEKKDIRGVFAMKKQLWSKAVDAMHSLYGDPAPIEITNRFLTEQAEMQNTDMIVYFDMLSAIASEAKKCGEHIRIRGGTGASFIAYIMGATDINPLKPHYYCPECRTLIFDNSADDAWDLPRRKCSCGKEMQADGHNIPFETYRPVIHGNADFDVLLSPEYIPTARSIVEEYFKDCQLTVVQREPKKLITFKVSSDGDECFVSLCDDEELTRCKKLECATATRFEKIPFACDAVLREFQNCNTSGITEFKTDFVKNMLRAISPQSFRELIQILGLSHGTGAWLDNGETLIENGHSAANIIAYRDDVFNYIREKMVSKGFVDTGFAYKVMEDTRRGLYANGRIPNDILQHLNAIGMESWFARSIGKIRYLFPKYYGVTCFKSAAMLMWYKIHYPKEFNEIML